MRKIESYRLPNEKVTYNSSEYISAWRKFAGKVAELIGGKIYAYDPDVSIMKDGTVRDVDRDICRKLVELADECESFRRENSLLRKKLEKRAKR